MAKKKEQSDGIRRRGSAHPEHTISLVGKTPREKVGDTSVSSKVVYPERKKEVPPVSVPKAVVQKRPESAREIFPEVVRKPKPPLEGVIPEKKVPPKTFFPQEKPEDIKQINLDEALPGVDKVSSWFFKKKPEEEKKEEDFYTGAGFNEGESTGKKKRGSLYKGVLVGGGALALGIILASTVFARLTVTIKPKGETIDVQDVSVVFDSSASGIIPKQKIIPAAKLELPKTVSQEYDSTGQKNASFPARGKARIFNAFNTSSQQLIATTRFLTDKGVLYRLPQAVTVPPAKLEGGKLVPQSIEVELVADRPGEGGNSSGELTLQLPGFQGTPRYGKFYAVASNGFSGGAQGERRVVTQEDRTRASEEVTKRVYDELEKEAVGKVPPDFTVSDSLKSTEIISVDVPSVDTLAERFTASASAHTRLIVFRQKDVLEFLEGIIATSDENTQILPDTVSLTYTVRSVDYTKGRAEVVVRGTIQTRSVLQESDLVGMFTGRKTSEIEEVLKGREDVESFSVSLFPFWLFSAPTSPGKITIKYE